MDPISSNIEVYRIPAGRSHTLHLSLSTSVVQRPAHSNPASSRQTISTRSWPLLSSSLCQGHHYDTTLSPTPTMPRKISASSRHIPVSNLDPTSFAPFGEVIQNPRTHDGEPALQTVEANQGSATKWLDVSHMENFYGKSSSGQEAKSVMNMFVCRPRKLREGRLFDVGIMERHPYTPQTFVPMGLGREDKETAYLIIVAPTLPREAWEVCEAQVSGQESLETRLNQMELAILEADNRRRLLISQRQQKGIPFHGPVRINPRPDQRGPPDLRGLKAFIARGDQAVTYGAGTWHAPMIVLGEREIEFWWCSMRMVLRRRIVRRWSLRLKMEVRVLRWILQRKTLEVVMMRSQTVKVVMRVP